MQSTPIIALSVAACVAVGAISACEDDFPTSHDKTYGTFGEEMFQLVRDELLWSETVDRGTSKSLAFSAHRDDVVWAFDTLALPPVDTQMLPFLKSLVPLYDLRADGRQGAMPQLTRDISDIMATFIADPATRAAMAQLDVALSPNPYGTERLIGALTRHPIQLLDRLADLTLELEPELTELFRWLHRELPTLEDEYVEASDEMGLLQRLVLIPIDISTEPLGEPVMTARFDGRGAPVVTPLPSGAFPPPFVDGDADGQVDVDEVGRPVDNLGTPIDLPTFSTRPTAGEERDRLGRAIAQGALLYDYSDLRRSAAAFALRDLRTLLEKGSHFDLFQAFGVILGGRVTATDEDGTYNGYFTQESPLLDLMWALNELRRYPRLVQLITALDRASVEKEPLLRQLLTDIAEIRQIFEGAPSLTEGNTFFEELHPHLARLARTGVIRDFFASSTHPDTQLTMLTLATKMSHTGLALPLDMSVLQTAQQVENLQFTGAVPWEVPDTQDSQRSMFQKATYLIEDTWQTPVYLNLFDLVEAQEVVITPNMARLYFDAIAGQATLDLGNDLLETAAVQLVSEFDDLNLSAEELNLFINHAQPAVGNPRCNQGFIVGQHYGPALLSMQAAGSLRALRPWVERIAARGELDTFIQVFRVLAKHYSETAFNDNGLVSVGTGIRRVEPFLVRAFTQTDFPAHLQAMNAWMETATFTYEGASLNVADEVDGFVRYLLDDTAGVTKRDGTTSLVGRQGAVIANPSRLQLMLDAFDGLDAALSADAEAEAAWERVDLVGLLFDLDGAGNFVNQHALDLIITLLPILSEDAAQSIQEPDWDESLDTFVPDLEEAMASRGFAALVDVMRLIRLNPAHRGLVDELLAALFAEVPPSAEADVFGTLLQVVSGTAQVRVPSDAGTQLLRSLGPVLDPDKRLIFSTLETLQTIRALDDDKVLDAFAQNLFHEPEFGRFPFRVLKDAFKAALRTAPGAVGAYTADDFNEVMGGMADWMRDEDKGMERMYEVIRNR